MASNVSGQLLWELVKGHNSFVRKNLHGNIFSAEKGNLYAKHSYKYSGIVNSQAVDIREGATGGVDISVKRAKTVSKPASAVHKVTSKKGARRAIAAVRKQVGSYRPDLQSAAVARVSAVHRALRAKAAKK
ncbi:60S ribosomal protein L28-1 [Monoraphidium neglectum]|uniref:60S ribosomal protein L28-1 n=1 Tax=Monoraphidium neglectum TaxID=145388 RepID=A0A0D2JTM5_9CHLO|nr:60S ribosomal protein L28-1 [Monoraphidium neglectum]KIZ02258.1 60S ribosomal protein L28-1 [Monoraphidium neglectum]|eukprot:XP_013901277.1 60S ribosomal protein L28-1 [Monoraphidium neglectum]